METLIGDLPRTQLTAARFLMVGDHVLRADLAFGIVTAADYLPEIDAASVSFADGVEWLGEGTVGLPTAINCGQAREWNLRRAQLDAEGLLQLHLEHYQT